MSMQVEHIRSLTVASLPMILLVCFASFAGWKGSLSTPLPAGRQLVMHQALTTTLPSQSTTIIETGQSLDLETFLAGGDPFFRAPEKTDQFFTESPLDVVLEEIHLSTIAEGKKGRYCIVNGDIFQEKQAGKGFVIKEISQDRVVFETKLDTFFLLPGQKAAIQSGKLVPLEKNAIRIETGTLKKPAVSDEQQNI